MRSRTSRRMNVSIAALVIAVFAFQIEIARPMTQVSAAQLGSSTPGAIGRQVSTASVANDPGPRGGSADAGNPIAGLSGPELEYFYDAKNDFIEDEDVDRGLGPRMNLDSCGGCHLHPAVGGSSPASNPQVPFASKNGGTDTLPSFISANGPVREVRFVRNHNGAPDGGVHALFTITGRDGADGCTLQQPDFDRQLARHNVIFRIPTPTFGLGLIEAIPDAAIVASQTATLPARLPLGIRGHANHNGNDGTIARFGWKAQNKSLLLFSGEAYNVEMGVTNEIFETERDETVGCQLASVTNDLSHLDAPTALEAMSDTVKFALFMRFLAPPTPSPNTPGGAPSIGNGRALFNTVGCALCHTPSFTTGNSAVPALNNQQVNLYSDLLVHDMGGLADGVSQGQAGPQEFRTAPLWGLGQRLFFLHDGRTSDLLAAILAHRSVGSEANGVIAGFNALTAGQRQDLLNFLRSL